MEENNNFEQNNDKVITDNEKNCKKRCFAAVAAAFLGGFLAVYFVADQIAERHFRDYGAYKNVQFDGRMFNDIEKMHAKEMKKIDKMMNEMRVPPFFGDDFIMKDIVMNPIKVKSEIEDDSFKVIIGLKPFQNDENKINYNITARKLTVFGSSEINTKNKREKISFNQDFILPENADISAVSKIKDGNKLIISVPLK